MYSIFCNYFFFLDLTLQQMCLLEELMFHTKNVLQDLIKNNYSIICIYIFIFTLRQKRRKQNVIKPNKSLAKYIM